MRTRVKRKMRTLAKNLRTQREPAGLTALGGAVFSH